MLTLFVVGVGTWQYRKHRGLRKAATRASVESQPSLSGNASPAQIAAAQEHYQAQAESSPDRVAVKLITEMVAERPIDCAMVLKQWLREHQA
jgi:flagellar biosynthesis/type III secretory pathway M-ring protein FliF/YscJ